MNSIKGNNGHLWNCLTHPKLTLLDVLSFTISQIFPKVCLGTLLRDDQQHTDRSNGGKDLKGKQISVQASASYVTQLNDNIQLIHDLQSLHVIFCTHCVANCPQEISPVAHSYPPHC